MDVIAAVEAAASLVLAIRCLVLWRRRRERKLLGISLLAFALLGVILAPKTQPWLSITTPVVIVLVVILVIILRRTPKPQA